MQKEWNIRNYGIQTPVVVLYLIQYYDTVFVVCQSLQRIFLKFP